ncbi:MAG: carbohydrate porin [Thermoanaerobaculales bacterium]
MRGMVVLLALAQSAETVATDQAMAPTAAVAESAPVAAEEPWPSVHFQATVITQHHGSFASPYAGANSLQPEEPRRTSETSTLFLGMRLPWEGGEFHVDPEIAGGEGFSGVTGIAGFPNGEMPRVSSPEPQPYAARLFVRQTFGLGGQREQVAADQDQIAGWQSVRRVTVTVGKFAAPDLFDANSFSHNPRTQFENWALMENGAWDYPADTRGYTIGLTVELNQPRWAVRYGFFTMPKVANGMAYDFRLGKAHGQALELEDRWTLGTHPGTVRVLAYRNDAHMGNYREAIDRPGPNGPDITLSETYSTKYGFGLNGEQEMTRYLGAFGRLGWNDGRTESFVFTEIDRTASFGLSLKGTGWHRPDDVVAVAAVVNELSRDHRDYLAAGGYGFIIGDGRLPHYEPEEIGELYYLFKLADHVFLTGDVGYVNHPAYNPDRGPVLVSGVRAHVEL